jgi:hypothetical protein
MARKDAPKKATKKIQANTTASNPKKSSTGSRKRKQTEDLDSLPKSAKKSGSSKKPKIEEPVFNVERILAKGWQPHAGSAGQSEWCYLIQWEEDAKNGVEQGTTSWEPIKFMKDGGNRKKLAEAFETRMGKSHRGGPPAWEDLLVGLEESLIEDYR